MRRRRNTQKGYALISAMAVGVVALSITSAVLLRMTTATKQVTHREQQDEVVNISEAVTSQVLDAMAELSSQTAIGGSAWGVEFTGPVLADKLMKDASVMNGYDFMNTLNNSGTDLKYTRPSGNDLSNRPYHQFDTSYKFFSSLQSSATHSQEFWPKFKQAASGSISNLSVGSASYDGSTNDSFSFEMLHDRAYTTYNVKKGGRIEADVRISIVPLATDISGVTDAAMHVRDTFVNHHDVFKIRVQAFVPNINKYRYTRTVDVIVNRPAKIYNPNTPFPEAAILTGGTANLGNADTTAGACAGIACIDDAQIGDVHVNNGDLIIGSNGSVQGKATATGKVTVKTTDLPYNDYSGASGDPRDTGDVTSRITGDSGSLENAHNSRSGAEKVDIPEFDTNTAAVDIVPCVNISTDPTVVRYKDCKLAGGYNKANNNDPKLELEGTVHIEGDFINKGSVRCVGTIPCRVVIDGKADNGGNGSSNYYSQQESLFIVRGMDTSTTPFTPFTTATNCLDIGGTPDASGANGTLYFVENPNCNTKFHGNFQFFGALFSNGTFEGKGNASAAGIQRDTDMNALKRYRRPRPMEKKDLFPKVISWKSR